MERKIEKNMHKMTSKINQKNKHQQERVKPIRLIVDFDSTILNFYLVYKKKNYSKIMKKNMLKRYIRCKGYNPFKCLNFIVGFFVQEQF